MHWLQWHLPIWQPHSCPLLVGCRFASACERFDSCERAPIYWGEHHATETAQMMSLIMASSHRNEWSSLMHIAGQPHIQRSHRSCKWCLGWCSGRQWRNCHWQDKHSRVWSRRKHFQWVGTYLFAQSLCMFRCPCLKGTFLPVHSKSSRAGRVRLFMFNNNRYTNNNKACQLMMS